MIWGNPIVLVVDCGFNHINLLFIINVNQHGVSEVTFYLVNYSISTIIPNALVEKQKLKQ